jgi:hypothetical protein
MNDKTGTFALITTWTATAWTAMANEWLGLIGLIASVAATCFAIRSYISARRLHDLTASQVIVSLCQNCRDRHGNSRTCPLPEHLRAKHCPHMKRKVTLATPLLIVVIFAALIIGCATAPPTRWEQKLFTIQTNVVYVTNVIPVIDYVTNDANFVVVRTNWVQRTDVVETYDMKPGPNADAIVETGRVVGNIAGGWGGIVGTVLAGVFGLWASLRSRKSNQTAAVLTQIIETGRAILQTTPQGQQLDEKWKTWMISHQAETGVITEVMKLVNSVVDEPTAKATAAKLLELMQPTPAQPKA